MICLITARAGSKTLPGKNIRLLNGKPLLAWSIETAMECGLRPVVSSDSQDYLDLAKRWGAETLLRPKQLAEDNTPHIEVIEHELRRLTPIPTECVLFQPTAPFRKTKDVLNAIELFKDKDYDSVISVVKVPDEWHPDECLQFVDGRIVMASTVPVKHRIRRRQDYRPAWVPSGGFYCFKVKNLAYGNFYGDRVGVYEVERTVNVNDQADWNRAVEIAKIWKS